VVPLSPSWNELDRKRYGTDTITFRRAKRAQKKLLELLGDATPGARVSINSPGDCHVTLEGFMDEAGHVRLANPDDEIVDRAALMRQLGGPGSQVRVLTHDGGMQLRAKAMSLQIATLADAYSKDQVPAPVPAAVAEAERAGEMAGAPQRFG
jgi:hypothetical protein